MDEFQALEQKVHRAVEIMRREREARQEAEAETGRLREQLNVQSGLVGEREATIRSLEGERSEIRERVERMLHQMDELL